MIDNKFCLLIVDDESKMTRALKDFFTAGGYKVFTAFNGEEALEVYYENNSQIDLILLDVMMPKMNGYEVLAELRENNEMVPVIMLTAKSEEYDQLKGLKNGADDYITKPFSLSLLLARTENLIKRIYKSFNEDLSLESLKISINKRMVTVDEKEIELKRREFELLYFLAINKNQIFTREQILDNVWGYSFDGDIRTVDTHIKQLRVKLGGSSKIIKTVHGVGYKLEIQNEN